MDAQSIVLCPCGKWHSTALRATERYRQRFRCGLTAVLNHNVNVYRYKGRERKIVALGSGPGLLFILLEQ